MNDAAWTGAEPFDPMGAQADHDFGNLIDFDNLDLDFAIDYAAASNDHDSSQQLTDLADSLHVQHLQSTFSPAISQDHHHGVNGGAAPQSQQQQQQQQAMHMSQFNAAFSDFNMPQFGQQPQQQQSYHPHAGVPPTPNSIEMHGDPGRYVQQQQQAMFDPRYMRKDDATFTPLVSPAVTPHEARFQVPDFNVQPNYFSPLTSPALNAQNHQQQQAHSSQYATTSGSSTGHSPIDVDMDMLGEAAMAQPEQQGRRLRSNNKRSAPRSTSTRVRQSPVVKPGRRKATVSSLIPPKEVSELMEEARASRPSSSGLEVPHSRESSEADSISPEPMLSEMGPPPKPASVTHSPAILAHGHGKRPSAQGATPATPASLMRIQPSPTYGGTIPEVPPMLDDLTLPEASIERPPLSRIDTAIHDDDADTPRLSARKTPKFGPLSTPSAGAAMSGRPSPMLSAVSSPTSPAFSQKRSGSDPKAARNPKKRNSVTSTLVSPALRPKISPSIKPLLPDGGKTDDTHALLLASKSNYQNILDGTTVPGVVYPSSLSTNLTSKRTSHKIAEQGRRNRINTALQEMQALLPSPHLNAADAKSPESSSAAQSNNSKAAKVESAIEYIRQLQKEVRDRDRMLESKDEEMENLRRELAALRRGSSASVTGDEGESREKEGEKQPKVEVVDSPEAGSAG